MPPQSADDSYYEKLGSWPYDWAVTERTLDPELLSAHGQFMLNRALNTRSVVVFAGSGVSSVYGRVSWKDLTVSHMEALHRFLNQEGKKKSEILKSGTEITLLASRLQSLISQAREGTNRALMLGMQMCEQIWSTCQPEDEPRKKFMQRLSAEFGLSEKYEELVSTPTQQPELGQKLFRHWMKVETYDELAHVRRVIHGGLWPDLEEKLPTRAAPPTRDDRSPPASPEQRQTTSEWIAADSLPTEHVAWLYNTRKLTRFRDAPRRYLPLFSEDALDEIGEVIGGWDENNTTAKEKDLQGPQGVIALARTALKHIKDFGFAAQGTAESDESKSGEREPRRALLQPSQYFAVGLLLDLCRWSLLARFVKNGDAAHEQARKDRDALFGRLRGVLESGRPMLDIRSNIIPPDRDPLYRLYYDFEIKRFVTTNYDLEIERLMEDLGFVQPESEAVNRLPDYDIERVSSMGGRARDIDLNSNTAIDLVDFAANESPHDLTVVHLHGRATEESELVVTERDYQTRYLGDDASQKMIREGLSVLFGGNPILFVGLGLSEDDLMRPLRQFVSNPALFKRNRTLIAFVPPTEAAEKRNAEAMEIYARYGVSVVYFGQWSAAPVDPDKPDNKEKPYWLQWIYQDAKVLSTALKAIGDSPSDTTDDSVLKDDLEKAIATLGGLFAVGAAATKEDKLKKTFFTDAKSHPVESDRELCDIALPLNLLVEIQEHVVGIGASADRLFVEGCRHVLLPAVERSINAILSAALSAKLAAAAVGWRDWWKTWKQEPEDRTNSIAYPAPVIDEQESAVAAKPSEHWTRYHIDDEVARRPIHGQDRFHEHGFGFFLDAVKAKTLSCDGRRIFVVVARRGDGKGHFFSTLTSHADHILTHAGQATGYAGAFFASFTFSAEIASVWDALIAFLADPRRREEPQHGLEEWAAGIDVHLTGLSRTERLQLVLEERTAPAAKNDRLLVALNAADLLVEPDGYPKNAEIRLILDLLLCSKHSGVPIDFIFIVRNDHIPLHFQEPVCSTDSPVVKERRKDVSRSLCAEMLFPAPPPKNDREARLRYEGAKRNAFAVIGKCGVLIRGWPTHPPGEQSSAVEIATTQESDESGERVYYFHVLNPAHPSRQPGDFAFKGNRSLTEDEIKGFDKLFEHVGKNRFLFSVALSARQEIPESKEERVGSRFRKDIEHSASASEIGRDERVLHRVLDLYATELHDPANDASDPLLCEAILRHLAVIAVPIDQDVLAHCPGVQRVARRILEKRPVHNVNQKDASQDGAKLDPIEGLIEKTAKPDRTKGLIEKTAEADPIKVLIGDALKLLFERRLVFKIKRYPKSGTPSWRFAVHRLVQLYVYRRLSVQPVEPTEGNFFTISLYASQQAGMPMLNASAYAFVDELINHLIGYPRSSEPGNLDVRAWCLRAGLSITRTLLPLGVVSRFADLPGLGRRTPLEAGHIEHRRLAVRWMLKAAIDNYQRQNNDAAKDEAEPTARAEGSGSAKDIKVLSPFYRDEIMWLYNECGVFSLAQGNMHDAHAMFGQALSQARRTSSPMRRRLLLNQGLAAMHRGRLRDARNCFVEIMEGEREHFGLKFMAQGYLGSCDHLQGQLEAATIHYNEAFKGLLAIPRPRAASIVARNLGDLFWHQGEEPKAREHYATSIRLAESSGAVDLFHLHRTALTRTMRRDPKDTRQVRQAAMYLQDAERYAEEMELPYVLAEALISRAEVQLVYDDVELAADYASRALMIARLYGLRLRKLAYLEALTRIYRARGQAAVADRLLERIVQSARDIGYRLLIARAHSESMTML